MQAKITKRYAIAPEGHTTVWYNPGDVVSGRVAVQAVADGHAVQMGAGIERAEPAPLENKIEPPVETKPRRKSKRKS